MKVKHPEGCEVFTDILGSNKVKLVMNLNGEKVKL